MDGMDRAAAMFVIVCLFGPFVYLGLRMAFYPDKFVPFFGRIASGVRRFQDLWLHSWREPFRGEDVDSEAPGLRRYVRFAGVMVAIFGLLNLLRMTL